MGKQRSKADIPVNVSAYSLRDVNETLVENRLRDSGFKNVPKSTVQSIVARGGIASKDKKTGESINIPVASLPTQKTYETIKGDVESASELFFQGLTDIPVSVSAGIQQMLAGTDKQKLDAIRKWQDDNTNQLSFAAKRMLENEEMSIEKFMFTAGNTVGQIVGSMATAAAGTAIGATAGTAVGGPVGTVGGAIGGFLGGMAVNMPFMYNSLLNSARDAGINDADAVGYAYGAGIGLAALEAVPLSKIAGWTAKSVAPSLTKSVLNKMTTKYGTKSANELIERIGADKFNKEVAVGVYKAARNGIADRVIGKAGAVGMGALAEGGQEITEFYLEKLAQATYDSTRGEGKQAGKGAFGTQFTQEEFFGKKARDEAFWNGVFGAVGGGFAGTVQAVSSPLYKTGVYDTIDTFVKRGKTVDEAVAALNGIIDRRIGEGELAQDIADTAKSAIQNVAQSYNKIGGKFDEPEFRYVVYERISKKDDLVKELGALESKKAEIQGIIAQNQGDADIYTVDMMEIDKLIDQKQRQLDFTSTWLKDYTQKYYDNKKAKNNTQGQFIDDSINDFIVRTDSFDKKKQTPYEFAKEANDAYNAGMKDIDLQYDSQVKSMNMSSLDENIDPDFDEIDTVKTKVRTNPSSSENPEFADVNIAIDENGEVAVKRETEDGALSYVRIANTPQYEPVVARAKSYFENRDSFEGIASKLVLGQELTADEAELYEDFADNIDGIKTEMQQRVGGKAKDALLKMNAKPIMEALQNMAPTVQRYQERISEIDETLAKNESIPASNQDLDSTKVNEKLSASEVAKLMQTKQDLLDAISKYNNELQRVTEMNPDDSSLDELDVKELAIYQAKMAEVDVLFNEMVERFYKNSSSNLKKFYEKNDEFDFLENMEEYAKSVAAQKRLFKSSYDKNLASKIGEIVTKAKILEAKMQENRAGIEAAKQKQEEAKAAKEQIKLEEKRSKEAEKILKEAKVKLEKENKKSEDKRDSKLIAELEQVIKEAGDIIIEAANNIEQIRGGLTNEQQLPTDSTENEGGVQSVQTSTAPVSGASETTLQENVAQGEITPEGEGATTMATDATESIVSSGSDDTTSTQGGGTQTQLPNVSGDVKAEAERLKNSIKGQFKILSDNNKTGEDGPDYIDPVSTKLGIASEGKIEVAKEGLNGFFYTKLASGIFGFVHKETGVILETNKSIVGLRKSIKDKQGKTDASIISFRAKLIADANKALENYIKERDNARVQKQQEEAILKQQSIKKKTPFNSNTVFLEKPISELFTDENRFQNRDELDEAHVARMVDNWDENQLDPIVIWTDSDGRDYVLAGHHRFEAAKRVGKKTISSKYFNGSESEAIEFAKEKSNANRLLEEKYERASIYRKMRLDGKSLKSIKDALKKEGRDWVVIRHLSYLSEKGKMLITLKDFKSSSDTNTRSVLESAADWIGAARFLLKDKLSDSHENELYEWLIVDGNISKISNRNEFTSRVQALTSNIFFDPSKPLDIKRKGTYGLLEGEKRDQIKEINKEIKKLEKERGNKKKPPTLERINEIAELIKIKNTELAMAMSELPKAIEADRAQANIFDAINENIEYGTITEETVRKFENSTDGELQGNESIIQDIESKAEAATSLTNEQIVKELDKIDGLLYQSQPEQQVKPAEKTQEEKVDDALGKLNDKKFDELPEGENNLPSFDDIAVDDVEGLISQKQELLKKNLSPEDRELIDGQISQLYIELDNLNTQNGEIVTDTKFSPSPLKAYNKGTDNPGVPISLKLDQAANVDTLKERIGEDADKYFNKNTANVVISDLKSSTGGNVSFVFYGDLKYVTTSIGANKKLFASRKDQLVPKKISMNADEFASTLKANDSALENLSNLKKLGIYKEGPVDAGVKESPVENTRVNAVTIKADTTINILYEEDGVPLSKRLNAGKKDFDMWDDRDDLIVVSSRRFKAKSITAITNATGKVLYQRGATNQTQGQTQPVQQEVTQVQTQPVQQAQPNQQEVERRVKEFNEKVANIRERIVVTGTDGGYKVFDNSSVKNKAKGAGIDIDPRRKYSDERYEVSFESEQEKKNQFRQSRYIGSYSYYITDKNVGRKYLVVGVSEMADDNSGNTEDRNGSVFVSVEDDGNLPSYTRAIMELRAIEEFESQRKRRAKIFDKLPQGFIDSVNQRYEQAFKEATGIIPTQAQAQPTQQAQEQAQAAQQEQSAARVSRMSMSEIERVDDSIVKEIDRIKGIIEKGDFNTKTSQSSGAKIKLDKNGNATGYYEQQKDFSYKYIEEIPDYLKKDVEIAKKKRQELIGSLSLLDSPLVKKLNAIKNMIGADKLREFLDEFPLDKRGSTYQIDYDLYSYITYTVAGESTLDKLSSIEPEIDAKYNEELNKATGKVSGPDIQNQLLQIKRNGSMTFDSGSQKFFNRFAAGIERIFPGVSIGVLSEQDWIDSGLSPSSRGAFNRKTGQVMLRESMYDGSTFVHEVGHAIMKIIGDVDTNLYNAMLDAVEGTKYEAYVRDNYPNLTTREEILSEAMGYAIQDKGVKMQSRPMAAFRDMMTKAFNAIKKFMGYRTNKDIGDMTLDDFTSEVAGIMFGIKDADIFLDEFDLTQNAELNNYFETEGNTDESSIQYQYFKFQANQQQVAKGIMRGSEYATFSGRVSAGEATMQETIDTLKSIVDSPILESQMASALTTGSGKDKFDGYSFIKANLNDFATDYYNIVTNTDAKNLTPLQNSDIVEFGNRMLETYADQHKRSHIEVVQDGKQVQVFVDPAKEASNVNKNVRSFFDAARAKGIMAKYTAKFLTGSMFSNLSNMDTVAQMLSGDNGIMKGIQDLRVHMNKVAARVHNGMRKAIYDATEELTQIARNRGRVSKLKEGNFKPLEEEVNISFHNNFTGDAELGNSNLTLGQLAYIYLARQTQVDSDFQRRNAGLLKSIANIQKEIDKAKKIGNSKRVSLLTTEMDAKQLELKNLKRDLDASDIIYDPTVKDGSHLSKYVISNNKRTNRGISFELENEQKVTILLTRDQMKVIDDMFENGGKYEEEMKVLRRFWSSDAVKNVFTEANEVKYRIEGGRAQEVFGTYIPIRKDTADSLSETSVEPNVKNMRFVLERTGLAGRIVGLDMFSIMNEYMEQNTEYIANAEYRDSLRTYRNSLTADDTSKNRLVSGADMEIVDAINTTLKGIDDMVRSIDSGLKSRRDANRELDKAGIPHRIYNLILSNFSKAVFSFNLGNLFKQSAGYLAGIGQGIVGSKYIYREMGYIGKIIPASMKTYITNDGKLFGKDFNGFFKVKAIEREMEYLEKHEYHFADILRRIQDESAYTGNIELDSLDFVLRKKGKLGDVYRAANKTIFKGLSAMRMNDAAVIIAFVRAARAEVTDLVRNGKLLDAENNPITDVESPKALRLIAEKASELVYRTNNMYMENDKTPLQRSNNILHKSIGLFSSQPQKISNLFAQRFMSAAQDGFKNEEKNKTMRSTMVWAMLAGATLQSSITIMYGILRNGYDEEREYELDFFYEFIRNFTGMFPSLSVEVLNGLLSAIDNAPWTGDIASNPVFSLLENAIKATAALKESMDEDKPEFIRDRKYQEGVRQGADALAKIFGAPTVAVNFIVKQALLEDKK